MYVRSLGEIVMKCPAELHSRDNTSTLSTIDIHCVVVVTPNAHSLYTLCCQSLCD
jgi:hypothetical protein